MFHLSLPVAAFAQCLAFYRACFDAEIVMLGERAANLYVFGGQLTLHDQPESRLSAARGDMHFGAVVSEEDWFATRDRLEAGGHATLLCTAPGAGRRGKLLVADPSGNQVEINSRPG